MPSVRAVLTDPVAAVAHARDLLGCGREVALVLVQPGPLVEVARGEVGRLALSPADVLRPVVLAGAPSYLLLHTHPGGGPPTAADVALTRRLVAASTVLGVRLTAHLVVSAERTWDCLTSSGRLAA